MQYLATHFCDVENELHGPTQVSRTRASTMCDLIKGSSALCRHMVLVPDPNQAQFQYPGSQWDKGTGNETSVHLDIIFT